MMTRKVIVGISKVFTKLVIRRMTCARTTIMTRVMTTIYTTLTAKVKAITVARKATSTLTTTAT